MRKKFFYLIMFVLVVLGIPLIFANNVYVASESGTVALESFFSVNVYFNTSDSDIYALDFNVSYNGSVLYLESITEGGFLSSDGAETIFYNESSFDYVSSIGSIRIYNARNKTYADQDIGITGQGIVAVLNFTSSNEGTSFINLSDVIWINSTIGNDSAGIENPTIINSSINTSNSPPPPV